jgi:hypothetical protein
MAEAKAPASAAKFVESDVNYEKSQSRTSAQEAIGREGAEKQRNDRDLARLLQGAGA